MPVIKFKQEFTFLRKNFKLTFEKCMSKNRKLEKELGLDSDREILLTINHLEKLNREINPTPENISYLVDNKKYLCPNGKFHPLITRKENTYQPQRIEIF